MQTNLKDIDWAAVQPVACEMVLFRQLQSEGVLLDMRGEEYYGLDEVATRLWLAMMAAPNLSSAVDVLLSEFEVQRDVLEGDIAELVNDLESRGLVSMTTSVDGRVA